MIIVAGWLMLKPSDRPGYLAGCREVLEQARSAPGCLDFSLTADLLEDGRINVYERWESEEELLAFRHSDPDGDEQDGQPEIVDADVRRFQISGEGPA